MDDAADLNMKSADANNPFVSVPVEVVVSVGKARPLIRDLVSLGENAILTLDKRVEDPWIFTSATGWSPVASSKSWREIRLASWPCA